MLSPLLQPQTWDFRAEIHGSKVGHQHTELEHTPSTQPLTNSLQPDSFHSWLIRGIAERVCDIGVWHVTFLEGGGPATYQPATKVTTEV